MGSNSIVGPLLTDLYQLRMAYVYWKAGNAEKDATFHLFIRKNPFKGEFTIFAGLSECLAFLDSFKFTASDLDYLRKELSGCEEEFFTYLTSLQPSKLHISAIPEGSVCFPRVPLIMISGPLVLVQLCETVFLNLVNFASLMATNAARFRIAAGSKMKLYEFGLRRAQGPDGGLSASKYSYLGGFDGTSNVLAGKLFNIPVKGTHAHSYVSSFTSLEDATSARLAPCISASSTSTALTSDPIFGANLTAEGWPEACRQARTCLSSSLGVPESEANDGEFAAFIHFAAAFPTSFLALIDTYDVIKSGILNFCAVGLALVSFGYQPLGVRIDSGDLAYLSNRVQALLERVADLFKVTIFANLEIAASNDINEETILSLSDQGHSISCYGIGTHLVTCQRQPALGGVFKLVSLAGQPRMKLSQDVEKMTLPGEKAAFRLFGKNGLAILDLLQLPEEPEPVVGQKVLCRHPFEESKRAWVTPLRVERLHNVVWSKGSGRCGPEPSLAEIRDWVIGSLKTLRPDHARSLNPCPYKVSVSEQLYTFVHALWMQSAPIGELS